MGPKKVVRRLTGAGYYEFESISYPYATKCCSVELNTSRMCGTISGQPACTTQEDDIACCDEEDDCVYNNICYTDDDNPETAEYNDLTCSEKHWCSIGFYWEASQKECLPAITMCYVGIEDDWCFSPSYTYPYVEDPFNCLYGGPESGPEGNPGPLPYEQACCSYSYFGITYYYTWQGIDVHGTGGGGAT